MNDAYDKLNVRGKNALVTGAGSGIGKAAALQLGRLGAKVALISRTENELKETASEFTRYGGESLILPADISMPDDMEDALEKIRRTWGHLDYVFANAGVNGVWAPIEDLSPDEFQKTININLFGTFLTIKYAVPLMKTNGGSIVITSSVNGTRIFSNTGATAYSTSKAGQVAMAKMLALELAKHRIRVNVICPGAITTKIDESTVSRNLDRAKEPVEFPEGNIPLTDGEPGRAGQVADLVLFLFSDMSSHISGTEMWIDGTESLLQG